RPGKRADDRPPVARRTDLRPPERRAPHDVRLTAFAGRRARGAPARPPRSRGPSPNPCEARPRDLRANRVAGRRTDRGDRRPGRPKHRDREAVVCRKVRGGNRYGATEEAKRVCARRWPEAPYRPG